MDYAAECAEHRELEALEASLTTDIDAYAGLDAEDRTGVAQAARGIDSKFSRIRALQRDLDLVLEEADRY
ncbi:hypothetical protein H632_c2540p1 [Helicosporidium sp. ATCC 50920]|nr:hypothetical protein H632_c2540p1 [Helicosporidium sp. ATCC 50920]|eukprot:KDD73098.1 hypothetical protein H632_c2540p1 [Helicosporidium sp. ATCC 50920]